MRLQGPRGAGSQISDLWAFASHSRVAQEINNFRCCLLTAYSTSGTVPDPLCVLAHFLLYQSHPGFTRPPHTHTQGNRGTVWLSNVPEVPQPASVRIQSQRLRPPRHPQTEPNEARCGLRSRHGEPRPRAADGGPGAQAPGGRNALGVRREPDSFLPPARPANTCG